MRNQEMRDKEEEMRKNVLKLIREKVVEVECPWAPYFYQYFNVTEPPNWRRPLQIIPESSHQQFLGTFLRSCLDYESFNFSIEPTVLGGAKLCSYSELLKITDFATDKFIQQTHTGRLFGGTVGEGSEARQVIVKTWDFLLPWTKQYEHHADKFCDEIEMLTDTNANAHPNLAKLCMFCIDTRLAAVYEEKFTVKFTVVLSDVLLDDKLQWDDRLKVATELANLLACLHEKGIAVGSITASCIMLNEERNIKVFDFGYVSNHVNEGSEIPVKFIIGRDVLEGPGKRSMRSDVRIFGFLLLELITKKELDWILLDEARRDNKRLVDECFCVDDGTVSDITDLTLSCTTLNRVQRPTMRTVCTTLTAMRKRGEKRRRDESEVE